MIVAIVAAVLSSGVTRPTVDATESISVTVSGVDGFGVASYYDSESWLSDAAAILEEEYDDYTDVLAWYLTLAGAVETTISPTTGLSNGDVVTVTVTIDEDAVADAPVKLKGGTVQVTVSGLTEAPTVNLTDVIAVVVSGYDGEGQLGYETDGLDEAVDEALAAVGYTASRITQWEADILEAVTYEVEILVDADEGSGEGLSNGDVVAFTFYIDEDALGDVPLEVVGGTVEYEVSGLTELQTIDLFEDIVVSYSGYAPYATMTISGGFSGTSVTYSVSYSYDGNNVSNGDVIVVTAVYDEQALHDAGYVAASDTTEIVVSGLDSYATTLADIPEEIMDEMKAQAENVMEAYVATKWSYPEQYDGMTYVGCYFLTPRFGELESGQSGNILYLVYQVDTYNSSAGDVTYYVWFRYTDIMLLADGTCSVDISSCTMTSEEFLSSYYRYRGFTSLESLYTDCVSTQIDEYACESAAAEE